MQSNNEHGIPISTSDQYTDSNSLLQADSQLRKVENNLPQVAFQENQKGKDLLNGYSVVILPDNKNSQINYTETLVEDIPGIVDETDKILDGICLSDEENEEIPNGNNVLSGAEYNQERKKISEFYEEDESISKYTGTKNEFEIRKEIPVPIELSHDDILLEAGIIENIFEDKIIIRVNTLNGVLDLDNILFNENKFPVGFLDDVIGKVESPYYLIKVFPNYDDQIKSSLNLIIGKSLLFPKSKSKLILTKELMKSKGCDASNAFDEEVNEDELEFSDDEEEVHFKNKKKNKIDKNLDFEKSNKKPKVEIQNNSHLVYNNITNPMFTPEYTFKNNNNFQNTNPFMNLNYSQNTNIPNIDMNSYMMSYFSNPNLNFNPLMQNFNVPPNNNLFNPSQNLPAVNPFQYPFKK